MRRRNDRRKRRFGWVLVDFHLVGLNFSLFVGFNQPNLDVMYFWVGL